MTDTVLLTPVSRGDFARLALQLESVEACGVGIEHLVVVNDEDRAALLNAMPRSAAQIITTSELLPNRIERWRAGRRLPDRVRRRVRGHIAGWRVQQHIKIAAAMDLGVRRVVCLDADVVFVGPVSEADFVAADGRSLLFEGAFPEALTASWVIDSMRALGVELNYRTLRQFIHNPTVLDAAVVRGMCKLLEERHGRSWPEVFDALGLTEYATHGVYARELAPQLVVPADPVPGPTLWHAADLADFPQNLARIVAETGARVVGVQSNHGVDPSSYRDELVALWRASRRS